MWKHICSIGRPIYFLTYLLRNYIGHLSILNEIRGYFRMTLTLSEGKKMFQKIANSTKLMGQQKIVTKFYYFLHKISALNKAER